jgi:hypothetical protein
MFVALATMGLIEEFVPSAFQRHTSDDGLPKFREPEKKDPSIGTGGS